MSVFIPGIKMPETCEDCRLSYTDQYGVTICAACDDCAYSVSCPLVPLPEGHGRLGDLDKLVANFRESAEECKRLADSVESDPLTEVSNKAIYPAIIEAILRIKAAPTIVPAEGGTDDGN